MPKVFDAEVRVTGKDDGASRVLDKLEKSFNKAGKQAQESQKQVRSFKDFLRVDLVNAYNFVAQKAQQAFALIKRSSDLRAQTTALKAQLGLQNDAYDQYIAKLKEVSRATVSEAQIVKSASNALLLGIPADKIAELLEVARASAIATGKDVSTAFDELSRGIGRSSPLILDNLGIVVKLGDVYERAAEAAGTTSEALSVQERKAALLNEVLAIGRDRVREFGDAQDDMAEAIQQGTAAMDDFKTVAGDVGGRVGAVLAASLAGLASAALLVGVAFIEMTQAFASIFGPLAIGIKETQRYSDSLQGVQDRLLNMSRASGETGESLLKLGFRVNSGVDIIKAVGPASEQAAAGLKKLTEAQEEARKAAQELTDQTGELGIVTSQVVAIQLGEMLVQLTAQRLKMGENSEEFKAYEKIATQAIDETRQRIESLQAGLGDVTFETVAMTEATRSHVSVLGEQFTAIERVTGATRTQTVAARELQAVQSGRVAFADRDPTDLTPQISGGTFTTKRVKGGSTRIAGAPSAQARTFDSLGGASGFRGFFFR